MLSPANPAQKKLLKEFCELEFALQVDYLIEKYGLLGYDPQFHINFRTNAVASYGGELQDGEPFISIAAQEVTAHVGKIDKFVYEEYDFLAKKEGIGNGTANWKQYLAWLIAHELAHTLVEVERFRTKVQPFFVDHVANDLRGHGFLWQELYRDIRVGFCTEDKYKVELVDFAKSVWHQTKTIKGIQYLTFFRGEKEIGWYLRAKKVIYKSNRAFTKKTETKYQNPREIYHRLVTV